jgi:hypothetical protein
MNRFKLFRKFSAVAEIKSDALSFDKIPGPKGLLGIGNFYNYFETFGEHHFFNLCVEFD